MTTLILILSLFGPIDRERFLKSLAEVESRNNPKAVGRAGEITEHQIAPIGFRELKRHGLSGTAKPAHALLNIKLTLMKKARVAETPANVALCWRHGITGAKRRKWRLDDQAIRVSNLYFTNQSRFAKLP